MKKIAAICFLLFNLSVVSAKTIESEIHNTAEYIKTDRIIETDSCSTFGYIKNDDTSIQKTMLTPVARLTNCDPPSQLYTSNVTSTTATFNWLPSSVAPNGGYVYSYGTSPTIGSASGNTVSTTANATNLLPNTTYYWWVSSNCGSDQSSWIPGGSFITPPPAGCWQKIDAGFLHSLGIKTDGTLWTWGSNFLGELGDGTTVRRSIPKQIGLSSNWQKIAAAKYISFAIKTDGTLWGWGSNSFSQLGDGTTVAKNIPTQIGTATDWVDIAVGEAHTLAIKTDGTLWAWGRNFLGQLGDGTIINKTVPTQIGTETNWKSIAAGDDFSVAIKTDGTLWSWGWNHYGQLGNGTSDNKTVPTQIGIETNWKSITAGYYHSAAINTNGILYTWGGNEDGQLGNGTFTKKLIPTAVADQVQSVDGGWYHTVGIKTSGSIFACGQNYNGQLGNSTPINIPNWVSVGNTNDYNIVSAGGSHTFAINNDSFLKACGKNEEGSLGDGTLVERAELVPIACTTGSLAVDEISAKEDQLKVYPNPVQDYLTVSFDQKILLVTVYNTAGQLVLTKAINDTKGSINVSGLPSGVYLVKVNAANDFVKTVKVIKR
ncbi:T9SS C-terminal target domain-containing protein [Chryseobacterium sp. G0186]|uniref:RCC1 domain-containing protein n=1 Tax=Chryseobacterium sp. G0186 TaxID=2487064 RepID=UPI000F4FDEF5|nr:T9SS type A sorting domain-containing protein [Chryseobacterium sp. G0186]AZA77196.1 T9SS C-terminal target domain-containing protein [Chryseobacterium sp. G0186]